LKAEVELQMPKKYEHVVKCRLSKRQRFLYDEFMSRTKTKETLEAGNFLSVINILMQLRKVCNHPDLFELRPTISPYIMDKVNFTIPSLVHNILPDQLPFNHCLASYELTMCAFQAHRTRQLKVDQSLIHNLRDGHENEILPPRKSSVSPSELSSSQFRPLSNVTLGEVYNGGGFGMESERSYFDCITPNITNAAGNSTIGDILTRQIQESLEAEFIVDVEETESETTDAEKLQCPAAKKPRLSQQNSNDSNSNIHNRLSSNRQSLTSGNENTAEDACDGLDSDDEDEDEDEQTCSCPDINNHNCGKTSTPGLTAGFTIGKNRPKKRPKTRKGLLLRDYVADEVSPFYLPSLKETNESQMTSRLSHMANTNEHHCEASPVYGLDLHRAVRVCCGTDERFVGAMLHQYGGRQTMSTVLKEVIKTPADRLRERKNLTDRFLLYVYPVVSQSVLLKTSHDIPWREMRMKRLQTELRTQCHPKFNILGPMEAHARLQFPETRLVQYDCGKLQTLDLLLRRLKAGKHRALIFTQMSRMLDVLERFLNYHGFIYVRLDGSTKVDQRQVLMERFNKDEKIFCFILSTRSGGMGVNLTGADTVIFYDSDWNPTMDAQAQDRCHRIGQTRDVHIYRLISDKTVEENILKKAQNKRILGNIAIEGGNFTAAYFKQGSLKELFETNNELEQTATTTTKRIAPAKTEEAAEVPAETEGKEPLKSTEYEEVTTWFLVDISISQPCH
jgi:E1A-binding protein p400